MIDSFELDVLPHLDLEKWGRVQHLWWVFDLYNFKGEGATQAGFNWNNWHYGVDKPLTPQSQSFARGDLRWRHPTAEEAIVRQRFFNYDRQTWHQCVDVNVRYYGIRTTNSKNTLRGMWREARQTHHDKRRAMRRLRGKGSDPR